MEDCHTPSAYCVCRNHARLEDTGVEPDAKSALRLTQEFLLYYERRSAVPLIGSGKTLVHMLS